MAPVFRQVKFVEQNQGRDLHAKFIKIMNGIRGIKDETPVLDGLTEDDQSIMSVPKRVRRPSF
jgi:hypothetical protein